MLEVIIQVVAVYRMTLTVFPGSPTGPMAPSAPVSPWTHANKLSLLACNRKTNVKKWTRSEQEVSKKWARSEQIHLLTSGPNWSWFTRKPLLCSIIGQTNHQNCACVETWKNEWQQSLRWNCSNEKLILLKIDFFWKIRSAWQKLTWPKLQSCHFMSI